MRQRLPREQQWRLYDSKSSVAKERAMQRLRIVNQIELLMEAGMTKSAAVYGVASTGKDSAASIWNWLRMVEGVDRHDQLAYLIPQLRGGGRRANVDQSMLDAIAADYLRPERPSMAECIRRANIVAKQRGLILPNAKTIWRRIRKQYGTKIDLWRGEKLPTWLLTRLVANDL